jgi:(p)ppGpp synthase/HD superfamily hydrolase
MNSLTRRARVFATRCHARQWRDDDGARFIEHPLEVAQLLRDAGCSEVVVAAGLLHDVLEDTPVSAGELRARFGADVTDLVCAVSDDAEAGSYRDRKRRLREQVRRIGGDAAVLFAADKISKVRELTVPRSTGRAQPASPQSRRSEARRELRRRLQVEHYEESLRMLRSVAPDHTLVQQLADELAGCPLTHAEKLAGRSEDRGARVAMRAG